MKQHGSQSNSKDPLRKRLLDLKSTKTFESFKKEKSPKNQKKNDKSNTNFSFQRGELANNKKPISKNSAEKIINEESNKGTSRRNVDEIKNNREKSLGNLENSTKQQRIYHRKIFSNEFGGFTGNETIDQKITAETGSNCENLFKKTPSKNAHVNIYSNKNCIENNSTTNINSKEIVTSKDNTAIMGVNALHANTNAAINNMTNSSYNLQNKASKINHRTHNRAQSHFIGNSSPMLQLNLPFTNNNHSSNFNQINSSKNEKNTNYSTSNNLSDKNNDLIMSNFFGNTLNSPKCKSTAYSEKQKLYSSNLNSTGSKNMQIEKTLSNNANLPMNNPNMTPTTSAKMTNLFLKNKKEKNTAGDKETEANMVGKKILNSNNSKKQTEQNSKLKTGSRSQERNSNTNNSFKSNVILSRLNIDKDSINNATNNNVANIVTQKINTCTNAATFRDETSNTKIKKGLKSLINTSQTPKPSLTYSSDFENLKKKFDNINQNKESGKFNQKGELLDYPEFPSQVKINTNSDLILNSGASIINNTKDKMTKHRRFNSFQPNTLLYTSLKDKGLFLLKEEELNKLNSNNNNACLNVNTNSSGEFAILASPQPKQSSQTQSLAVVKRKPNLISNDTGNHSRETNKKKDEVFYNSSSKEKYNDNTNNQYFINDKSKDKKNLKKKYLASFYSLGLKKQKNSSETNKNTNDKKNNQLKDLNSNNKKNSLNINSNEKISHFDNAVNIIMTNEQKNQNNFKKTKSLERKNKKTDYKNLYNYISNKPDSQVPIAKEVKQNMVSSQKIEKQSIKQNVITMENKSNVETKPKNDGGSHRDREAAIIKNNRDDMKQNNYFSQNFKTNAISKQQNSVESNKQVSFTKKNESNQTNKNQNTRNALGHKERNTTSKEIDNKNPSRSINKYANSPEPQPAQIIHQSDQIINNKSLVSQATLINSHRNTKASKTNTNKVFFSAQNTQKISNYLQQENQAEYLADKSLSRNRENSKNNNIKKNSSKSSTYRNNKQDLKVTDKRFNNNILIRDNKEKSPPYNNLGSSRGKKSLRLTNDRATHKDIDNLVVGNQKSSLYLLDIELSDNEEIHSDKFIKYEKLNNKNYTTAELRNNSSEGYYNKNQLLKNNKDVAYKSPERKLSNKHNKAVNQSKLKKTSPRANMKMVSTSENFTSMGRLTKYSNKVSKMRKADSPNLNKSKRNFNKITRSKETSKEKNYFIERIETDANFSKKRTEREKDLNIIQNYNIEYEKEQYTENNSTVIVENKHKLYKKPGQVKQHRKTTSMPFNDSTNQLIRTQGLPINLDSKKVASMTPDISKNNSRKCSTMKKPEQNSPVKMAFDLNTINEGANDSSNMVTNKSNNIVSNATDSIVVSELGNQKFMYPTDDLSEKLQLDLSYVSVVKVNELEDNVISNPHELEPDDDEICCEKFKISDQIKNEFDHEKTINQKHIQKNDLKNKYFDQTVEMLGANSEELLTLDLDKTQSYNSEFMNIEKNLKKNIVNKVSTKNTELNAYKLLKAEKFLDYHEQLNLSKQLYTRHERNYSSGNYVNQYNNMVIDNTNFTSGEKSNTYSSNFLEKKIKEVNRNFMIQNNKLENAKQDLLKDSIGTDKKSEHRQSISTNKVDSFRSTNKKFRKQAINQDQNSSDKDSNSNQKVNNISESIENPFKNINMKSYNDHRSPSGKQSRDLQCCDSGLGDYAESPIEYYNPEMNETMRRRNFVGYFDRSSQIITDSNNLPSESSCQINTNNCSNSNNILNNSTNILNNDSDIQNSTSMIKPNSTSNVESKDVFEDLSTKNEECDNKGVPMIVQKSILKNRIKDHYDSNEEDIQTSLDFYKVKKLLGEGSFGKVYSAISIQTDREVAIKCFDKGKIKSENAKRKIFNEVLMQKTLDHPNVIKLLEVFENKRYIFFVMEYAEEGDILKLQKKRGPLEEKLACFLCFQIIQGLKHCHSRDILHRDIKLDNIFLGNNFETKIGDFGVSKILKPNQIIYEQCGTPAYIAPEIIKGEGYGSCKPDIWNLGILLYAMVTGTVPFRSNSIETLHKLIQKGEYEFPEKFNLSPDLKDLIKKILVLNPEKRITLDGILKHNWMKQLDDFLIEQWKKSCMIGSFRTHKILKVIEEYGFTKEAIKRTLKEKILNHMFLCYNLLKYF